MKWGISVPWMTKLLINMRDDSIFDEKKSWTKRFTKNRCIVPIDGFYEWLDLKSEKIPYYIGIEGQEWIGLAGVYVAEKDAKGNEIKCFAIVTWVLTRSVRNCAIATMNFERQNLEPAQT
jgi:putative SOS response-associated peptidase YedK